MKLRDIADRLADYEVIYKTETAVEIKLILKKDDKTKIKVIDKGEDE